MRTRIAIKLLLAFALTGVGYVHATEPEKILVRIFHDGNAPAREELDRRIAEISHAPFSTKSGQQIFVAPRPSSGRKWRSTYRYLLDGRIGRVFPTEIVVLNSVEDAKGHELIEADAAKAVNICGPNFTCMAFVPSWVKAQDADAAHVVLQALHDVK